MSETTFTNSNAIPPIDFEAMKKLLEDQVKFEEQMPQLIANLVGAVGWKVYRSKYMQKGTVFVGTGELDDLFPAPELTPSLPTETK